MSKARSKASASEPKRTLEEFLAAVRYLLVSVHGMPALVADEVMKADSLYVKKTFEEGGDAETSVIEVADELWIRPATNREWVKLDKGQLVLTIEPPVDDVLKRALETGLFGTTTEEVARALLCRGIEAALPALQLALAKVR